jgi:hypothetical protein
MPKAWHIQTQGANVFGAPLILKMLSPEREFQEKCL